jgi:hypothetical protein
VTADNRKDDSKYSWRTLECREWDVWREYIEKCIWECAGGSKSVGDFGQRNPLDVMGKICPECYSSSSIGRERVKEGAREWGRREKEAAGKMGMGVDVRERNGWSKEISLRCVAEGDRRGRRE